MKYQMIGTDTQTGELKQIFGYDASGERHLIRIEAVIQGFAVSEAEHSIEIGWKDHSNVGMVTVYKPNFFIPRQAEVSWACNGGTTPAQAAEFVQMLQMGIRYANEMNAKMQEA